MKYTKLVLLLILIPVFHITVNAQYNFLKVDDWLNTNANEMGGRCYLMIYKDGKIVYSKAATNMNMIQKSMMKRFQQRQGKPVDLNNYTDTTKIAMASCSKWFSAALVMTFVDEGKLHLEDTVGKFLPVLSQHEKGNITISECLSHLTGIKAPPLKENLHEMRDVSSMDEAMEKVAVLPMEGAPGTVFHYSNTGLQIAGAVIEKISGKSFQALFKERIAEPLDMPNSDFGTAKVALPAGGAFSTPTDYTHFLEMILNKGTYNGKRILSEKAVAEMQVNRINKSTKIGYSPTEAGDFGYGFGEWVMEKSTINNITTAVTSPGLFGSFPWVENQEKYTGFLMCFYLKNEGRHTRYTTLKSLVDDAVK